MGPNTSPDIPRRRGAGVAVRLATLAALNVLLTAWAGCFGCPCGSGPGGMHLTAGPLDLDVLDGASTVRLEIVVANLAEDYEHAGGVDLLPGGPAGWILPAGIEAVPAADCAFVGEATFTLLVDGGELPDPLPPITVEVHPDYGGQETVVLWEDWIVDIDWGGWVA